MQSNNSPSSSDEIDLGQLLQLVRKGLNGIFKGFLRVFLFFKRNTIKLISLIIIGVGIGFLLNYFVEDKLQTEAIVKPNFESKDYLYDVVKEIKSKISTSDTVFFKSIEIDVSELRKFTLDIKPIDEEVEVDKETVELDNKYLEILQNYKDNDFVIDIVKSEILKKSIQTHRITFTHKNAEKGEEYATKILAYINSNPYYNNLQLTNTNNAKLRIDLNNELIKQIDNLVLTYSTNLNSQQNSTDQSLILLEGESSLNIANLLSIKNRLFKENEEKQLELVEESLPVSVLNIGKTHSVGKKFFTKNFILIPILLIGLFFLVSFIAYLNRKSLEI